MYTVKIWKRAHGPGPPQSQKVQSFCEKGPGLFYPGPHRTGYAQNLFNSCKTCDNIIKYIYTESFIRLFVFHNYFATFCTFFATFFNNFFQILVTIFDNL